MQWARDKCNEGCFAAAQSFDQTKTNIEKDHAHICYIPDMWVNFLLCLCFFHDHALVCRGYNLETYSCHC